MCERWVGDWTNCNILTPSSFFFSSTSLSFYWAAQSGVLRAHSPLLGAGSLFSILSPTNWLQLTEPVCGTRYYNCLTSTCFLWASHLHPIQPIHISSTGYTSYLHRCIWQLGRWSICYNSTMYSGSAQEAMDFQINRRRLITLCMWIT